MSVDLKRWPELSRLLDEALDLPDREARASWLASLGEEHGELKASLAAILAGEASLTTWPSPPLTPRLAPGSSVGPYRLERELGRGGMAVVWLARRDDAPDGPAVALKLPHVSLQGAQFLERFQRESRFLGALEHPNIARFVDAGVDASGQQYLALEFVDGVPLVPYCDEQGLGVDARVRLFLEVVAAVGHAHSRDILHRDLKPSNVLVAADGKPRLLDFGVAKLLVEGRAQETELTAAIGRPLTPEYASPEQLAGAEMGAASDVYTLGVILHELLCGARPRAGPAGAAALPSESVVPDSVVARAEGTAARLARRLRGRLDALILKALDKDARSRHATAAALASDLEAALAPRPAFDPRAWLAHTTAFARRYRLVGALAALMWLTLGSMQAAHRVADDLQQLVAAPLEASQQVALVVVTPEDYRGAFKARSPLDAGLLERLVERIAAGRPAVIGVDIDTDDPAFAGMHARASSLPASVVWARANVTSGEPLRPDEGLAQAIAHSDDGLVRRYARAIPTQSGPQPSFVAAVARNARAGPPVHDADPLRARHIRFTGSERFEIPASVVLADGFEWKGRIEDRLVLLGGRYDRADMHDTPLGRLAGVDVVANALETELRNPAGPPGMAAFLLVGLVQLVVLMLIYDNFTFWRGFPLTIAWTVAFSAFLAFTGIFPAWPYALFAMFIVLLNQLVLELLRKQRKTLHETVSPKLKGWKRPRK